MDRPERCGLPAVEFECLDVLGPDVLRHGEVVHVGPPADDGVVRGAPTPLVDDVVDAREPSDQLLVSSNQLAKRRRRHVVVPGDRHEHPFLERRQRVARHTASVGLQTG